MQHGRMVQLLVLSVFLVLGSTIDIRSNLASGMKNPKDCHKFSYEISQINIDSKMSCITHCFFSVVNCSGICFDSLNGICKSYGTKYYFVANVDRGYFLENKASCENEGGLLPMPMNAEEDARLTAYAPNAEFYLRATYANGEYRDANTGSTLQYYHPNFDPIEPESRSAIFKATYSNSWKPIWPSTYTAHPVCEIVHDCNLIDTGDLCYIVVED